MMSYWLESTKDNRKEFDKLEKYRCMYNRRGTYRFNNSILFKK